MAKKSVRVMVVEDHEATAYLILKAFGERSARVDWLVDLAVDGESALDYILRRGKHATAERPDIVLLDWNLPRVSGHEVLRVLKSSDELRTVTVLVFSSSQDDEVVKTAYRGCANGYISKPSDLDSFYAVVDNIETFWVHTARLPAKPI